LRLGSLEIFIACTAVIIVYIEFNGFVTEIIVILEENVIVMRLVMSVFAIVFKIYVEIQNKVRKKNSKNIPRLHEKNIFIVEFNF